MRTATATLVLANLALVGVAIYYRNEIREHYPEIKALAKKIFGQNQTQPVAKLPMTQIDTLSLP